MTTLCVVQARVGSSRLPGKVLERIGDRSMLAKVLLRLARSEEVDELVVATTTDPGDEAVVEIARECGVGVVRGSRLDVLDRFHQALDEHPGTDVIVRVTADCPFVDPGIVDELVRVLRTEQLDFVANRLPPPYSRTYPIGLDVEVCTAAALERAWREAREPYQREHVMPYLYDDAGRFRLRVLDLPEDLSRFRWTVDTPDDLEALRLLDRACGPEPFGWRRVLEAATNSPDITAINAERRQRHVEDVDEKWSSDPPTVRPEPAP